MTLHLNGRLHLQAPAAADLGERLERLFGAEFHEQVLPIADTAPDLQVCGYIARATLHRATRRQQFFFVNGRAVQNRVLSRALYEAYRTLLPRSASRRMSVPEPVGERGRCQCAPGQAGGPFPSGSTPL